MLVLNRRRGESLLIGEDITVTVLSIAGQQVKLGIAGPRSVPIHREEVYKRVQAEKEQAKTERICKEISSQVHIKVDK